MFYFLSKILDVLLSPYTWAVGCLVLAIPWRRPRRRARWRRRRLFGITGLGLLLFFSLEPVADVLLYWLEHRTVSTYRSDVTYDAVVLLGGVVNERVTDESGQSAYNDNVERLVATHRLLAEGKARFAIVSAAPGAVNVEAGEPRVLARQMVAWGADPSRILLEERAMNTRENAVFSQRIAQERGFRKVLIVTSAFHMKRAAECFAAVGMNVDTLMVDYRAPDPFGPSSHSWIPRASYIGDSSAALREIFGLYIYRLRGYATPVKGP